MKTNLVLDFKISVQKNADLFISTFSIIYALGKTIEHRKKNTFYVSSYIHWRKILTYCQSTQLTALANVKYGHLVPSKSRIPANTLIHTQRDWSRVMVPFKAK